VTTRSATGSTRSITGTAVTPEFLTYGILPDGTRWSKTVQGETANSPRFAKSYKNLLGQTIREERSGFKGAVLATIHAYDSYGRLVSTSADYEPTVEYTYDTFGNRTATTRVIGRAGAPRTPQSDTTEWRKSESLSHIAMIDGDVWLTQTNIVSCSDSAIAPLVSSSSRQLTGLTAALHARSRSTDIRGNVTENETLIDSSFVTSRQTLPYATNKPLSVSRYGVSLIDVSVSAVTNTVAYDFFGRQISSIDGRGNTRRTEYNAYGQHSASIDALGNRTTYSYDQFGNLATVIDPLGHATIYEYDLRGRKTYEGGATYPVRYSYDIFGNKSSMMTYRNESLGPDSGDVTTWLYDIATGAMTNKVYADGNCPTYNYTPDGKLSRRTWARGITTDYSYDSWGGLTNTVYSDNTPTVTLAYDAFGRQTKANDAAGITTFLYDSFGSITNETVIDVAGTNIIIRHWDNYGRTTGYSLVGIPRAEGESQSGAGVRDDPIAPQRHSALAYDSSTGRLASMLAAGSETPFVWNYLDGSDLKSSLSYPNGLTASWSYDANNQLLQVCNATPTNVISQYDYTYDAAGRCVYCGKSGSAFTQDDTVAYSYNNRSELTNAVAAVDSDYRYSYNFDDIGNRESSSERGANYVCAANQLNQYTAVDDFTPLFDDDGNQTLVKTATGIWQVTYNGENRPARWIQLQSNNTNNQAMPVMLYDRMGRRVSKDSRRFRYNGYLQIADSNGNAYFWDPTETVTPRVLMANIKGDLNIGYVTYYCAHDGNNNVSGLVREDGSVTVHYDYTPFGEVMSTPSDDSLVNPWRFASEFFDDELALMYYNYRHYNPVTGRWIRRDPIGSNVSPNFYLFVSNNPVSETDRLGLYQNLHDLCQRYVADVTNDANSAYSKLSKVLAKEVSRRRGNSSSRCKVKINCACCNGIDRLWEGGNYIYTPGSDAGRITVCENALANSGGYGLEREYLQRSNVESILHHEMLHALQACMGDTGHSCADHICREIHAYYNSTYATEPRQDVRRQLVLTGVLKSAAEACKSEKEKMKDIFDQKYEECKGKYWGN
jgi:RHS repeat-associated protein